MSPTPRGEGHAGKVERAVLAAAVVAVGLSALSAISSSRGAPVGCVGASCASPAATAPVSPPDPSMAGPIEKVNCKKWYGGEGVLKYGDVCWVSVSPTPSPGM